MTIDTFKFDSKKFAASCETFGLGTAAAAGLVGASIQTFTVQPAAAEVPPEVQAVVTNTTDTLPVLTGICLAVFSAGLAPWAARTTLSWLSSIMKGAI